MGHLDVYWPLRYPMARDTSQPASRVQGTAPSRIRSNGKRQPFGADELRLREEIGFYSHLLVDLGLLEFKGGNLSARIDEHDMLITKRAVAKAIPSPEDIVRTSIVENDEASFQASSAMEVHRAIYQ